MAAGQAASALAGGSHEESREGLLMKSREAQGGAGGANNGLMEDAEEEHEVPSCGLLGWRPPWLQRFAKAKVYAAAHGSLGFAIRATRSYYFGILTTIEKRFAISSKTTGLISSAFELGVIGTVSFLGYIGHRLHAPKTVVTGAVVLACACMMIALPHFIFGAGEDARTFARLNAEAVSRLDFNDTSKKEDKTEQLCGLPMESTCGGGEGDEGSGGTSFEARAATGILLTGLAVNGMGETTKFSIGFAYLDNNAHKNRSPILLAGTQLIEMFGNMMGYALASFTLSLYVDPSVTPPFNENHPRWIGAWWLGWPILTAIILVTAAPILLFPRELPGAAKRRRELGEKAIPQGGRPTLQEFKNALGRMIKNKILVLNTLSAVCLMIAYDGFMIFMPKYMETQFKKSASEASFISGWVGLLFTGFGMLASAAVIVRYQPSARSVAAWNVIVELFDAISHFIWAFFKCAEMDISGHYDENGSWNLTEACNADCGCNLDTQFFPVCSSDGSTSFYSPCHAGCSSRESFLNGTTIFKDCACIEDGLANYGPCPADCTTIFSIFIAMRCVATLLEASGRAGNILVVFRSVSKEDKTLCIAIAEVVICLLAYFPTPNLFGAIVDSTCLVWGSSCGRTGNCWVYDERKMRYVMNFTAGGCLLVGTALDAGVWYYSTDVELYEKSPKDQLALEGRREVDKDYTGDGDG